MTRRWGLPVGAWPLRVRPNLWDGLALLLVFGAVVLVVRGGAEMAAALPPGEPLPLSLDPADLPHHALRTTLRMAVAMVLSLVFSLAYAALAARNRAAERLLIPLLDILQSVPILGFLSVTVTGFVALFPGRLLGLECAAIFAIFTSQAWNLTFSLYQSFRTVPLDLVEAARVFRLSPWRRFWRLEVPFAVPQLVWNLMMSAAGGWFFVVAAEAITVSGRTVMLPGIGSFIAQAIVMRDAAAVGWAILAMLGVILAWDQVIFRPLLVWSDRFKPADDPEATTRRAWLLTLWRRTRLLRRLNMFAEHLLHHVPLAGRIRRMLDERTSHRAPKERFLVELQDELSSDEAERVLATIIDWGRYAELFAYDAHTGVLSLDESP